MTTDYQDAATVDADDETVEETAAVSWFDEDDAGDIESSFREYDITASPNDFNIRTIVDFVGSGAVKIPGFQRNYVWDIRRASRLIESLLIGLPIPQIFLYEEGRNSFLVIDGQQRLMSIFYFVKGRFPRREKRPYLRRVMDAEGTIPPSVMANDEFFQNFKLSLLGKDGRAISPFHNRNFETLEDYKTTLEMRTIRNVVVKQTAPEEDEDSSVFEMFNRLNTGGVNLRPQEIRSSLFHSKFTEMLHRINVNEKWRSLVGLAEPDLHEKDIEILLRAFALTADGGAYKEPMSAFLNSFARKARTLPAEKTVYAERLFAAFFDSIGELSQQDFAIPGSGRFNIAVFEAVFRAACYEAFADGSLNIPHLSSEALALLKADEEFISATRYGVGRTTFVNRRFERARSILLGG